MAPGSYTPDTERPLTASTRHMTTYTVGGGFPAPPLEDLAKKIARLERELTTARQEIFRLRARDRRRR